MTTGTAWSRWLFPTLRGYRSRWLGRDVLAGAATGAVIIPQAMAYATIAGMPVEVGLYTCIVPLIVYAAVGGSPVTSSTTTSTIATLTASSLVAAGIAGQASADGGSVPGALATLVLLTGAFLLVGRLLGLGSLVENISEATLVGIKVGVGLTVAIGQVPALLGIAVDTEGAGFIRGIAAVVERLGQADPATVVLSAGSILVLVVLPRLLPRIPATLVVVLAGITVVATTAIEDHGVALIAPVPPGLPSISLPDLGAVGSLVPGAAAIAVMAFLETVSVGRNLRTADQPPIESNRELLAAGLCCVGGGLTSAMPSAGGFSQSAVNQQSGARSQVAGLTTAALALLVALLLAPVLDDLPQATLAAIVFVAVLGLVDVRGLAGLRRLNRAEFGVAAVTALLGLSVGLLAAVAFGVVATVILVLREVNRPSVAVLGRLPEGVWVEADRAGPQQTPAPDGALVVTTLQGLYAANMRANADVIVALGGSRSTPTHPIVTVVLDLRHQPTVTSSVLKGLADLDRELEGAGRTLYLASIREHERRSAVAAGLAAPWNQDGRAARSVDEALATAARRDQRSAPEVVEGEDPPPRA